jgi:hypothetical protein
MAFTLSTPCHIIPSRPGSSRRAYEIRETALGERLTRKQFDRSLLPSKDASKYSVLIRRRSGRPPLWTWEIQRRPEPLKVRFYEDGFKSPFAAKLAGEKALRQFLDQLAKEEQRQG